jgi:hypothetical protein
MGFLFISSKLFKHSSILLICLLFSKFGLSQNPKLVLPIGHMSQVEDAFFTENEKRCISTPLIKSQLAMVLIP